MNKQFLAVCLILLTFLTPSLWGNEVKHTNLVLDGKWEIIFDDKNEGVDQKWYLDENYSVRGDIRQIDVPSCWEEFEKNYEGVAFYRKKVYIPSEWSDRRVNLNFKASNYLTEVWVNDEVAGFHEGGYTPFSFRIDKLLKFGEQNSIVVRVISPIILTDKRIDGLGRQEVPMWRGAITGGIWQSVSLSTSDLVSIKDVFIEPKIATKEVTFNFQIENVTIENIQSDLKVTIFDPSGKKVVEDVKSVATHPGVTSGNCSYKLSNMECWSIENPYLYRVQFELLNKDVQADAWSHKFGMREFTVKDNTFYLNGKPIYLKASFYEGLYPTKLAYPDSYEMAVKEVQLAKEAGFNMIRPWRKPAPDMWLNICDSIGMMTVGSLVTECMKRPISTPRLPFVVENELTQTILSNRNRTCIVQWELFNEINRPILAQMLNAMSVKARDLDPSRMILDESGGWGAGANLYLPYERIPFKFNDVHHYSGCQIHEGEYNAYLGLAKTKEQRQAAGLNNVRHIGKNVVDGIMSYLSEIGYGSCPDLIENNKTFEEIGNPLVAPYTYHKTLHEGFQNAMRQAGFDKIYPDLSKLYKEQQLVHGMANKRMIEAIRSNDQIKGYCVHALVAGDWVQGAGLLDLWRNPKKDVYEYTKAASQPVIAPIRILPRNVYQGDEAKLDVKLISEYDRLDQCMVAISVKSAKGKQVFSHKENLSFNRGINKVLNESLATAKLDGEYIVSIKVTNSKGTVTENKQAFNVIKRATNFPKVKFAVVDIDHSLTNFLKGKNVQCVPFNEDTDLSTVVLVGRANLKNKAYVADVEKVMNFVKRGGKALFLEVPGKQIATSNRKLLECKGLESPFEIPMLSKWMTFDGWSPRSHIVTDHPIFKGMPVNQMMKGVYENVNPITSMCKIDGKYISGVVGYDHFPDSNDMLRHYNGHGDVWWAATVLEHEVGEGMVILSTLRLIPNLNVDPVADLILCNMLNYILNHE